MVASPAPGSSPAVAPWAACDVRHELSRRDARRIAVRAQWLHADRPTRLLPLVRHISLLQLDPTAAVAPTNVTMLLSFMVRRGEVAVAGRAGKERLWDLAERVYPDELVVPAEEADRRRNERRLAALGVARSRGPECPVEPLECRRRRRRSRRRWRQGDLAGRSALGWASDSRDGLRSCRRSTACCTTGDAWRTCSTTTTCWRCTSPRPPRRWVYYALPVLYGDRSWASSTPPLTAKPESCTSTPSTGTSKPARRWSPPSTVRSTTFAAWLALEPVRKS